jgi:hypothetical protein
MAAYLEREALDVLHPVGLTQLTKKFANRNNAEAQVEILKDIGASTEEITACKNVKQRKELFRNLTKRNHQ